MRSGLTVFLCVAHFALAACRSADEPPSEDSSVDREAASLLAERRVEPRLTIGADHGECRPMCSPGELCEPECAAPDVHKLDGSVSTPDIGIEIDRGAEGHIAALRTLVAEREEANAEKAVEMLEQLVQDEPSSAALLSDLAAAYLVRAQRAGRPQDLVLALSLVERAVQRNPRLAAARFNQALVLEALFLRTAAFRAWQSYLSLDPDSGWGTEAAARRDALHAALASEDTDPWTQARPLLAEAVRLRDQERVQQLVDPLRFAARRYAERELLSAWAAALEDGEEAEASQLLATARMIALALAELSGDTFLADTVAAIDAARQNSRAPGRLQGLIRGHKAYGEAAALYRDFQIQEADRLYRRARNELARGHSPFSALAELYQAICLLQNQRFPDALQLLRDIHRRADPGYLDLAGRVLWTIALCHSFEPEPLAALRAYRDSLARFEAAGEVEYVASVHARLAEVLRNMGESELAWSHRYRALPSTPRIQDWRQSFFVFAEAAAGALALKLPLAALRFQNEAIRRVLGAGNSLLAADVLRQRAEMSLEAGWPERALRSLEMASELKDGESDAVLQQAIQARIEEVEGLVRLESAPLRAAQHFTEALRLLPETELLGFRAQLHLERARAYRAEGLVDRAESDLARSLRELEREWQRVLDRRRRGEGEELWPSFFAHRKESFDLMIRLLADEGRAAEALDYAERFRARELLDLLDDLPRSTSERPPPSVRRLLDKPGRPLRTAEIENSLPAGVTLVEYAALDDQLLAWVITHRGTELVKQPVARHEIAARVRLLKRWGTEFARQGQVPDNDVDLEVDRALSWLHARLVTPALAATAADGNLVFVSDPTTHGVPFSALRDPRSGRHLVEDHEISVAPSATLYVYSLRRNRELPTAESPGIVAVGDPAFDPASFPDLKRLPAALTETDQIAGLYPHKVLLQAEAATRGEVLGSLDRYQTLHFAGHAIPNPRAPFRSALVLAGPSRAGRSGALYAQDLLRLESLRRTRLVVLSACSTAGGQSIGALEVSGLVRPILGAGVPAVVGSLWDVHDFATARLLTAFHRRYRDGADASSALRGAQLELLRGSNQALKSALAWAPFQVIGVASPTDSSQEE